MSKIEKITQYVSELLALYEMNDYGFFNDYDDELECMVEVPLFPHGEIDEETLTKISTYFGITKEELLNTDEGAKVRYWQKYPFFSLYKEFLDTQKWYKQYKDKKPTQKEWEERLLKAIFSTSDNPCKPFRARYDIADIKNRLIEQLKEINKLIPSTYHEGAEITNFHFYAYHFFSFPKCTQMLQSFIDIVNRTEDLFFKAIHSELIEEEINELNFLASWLNAVDIAAHNAVITYDNVRLFKDIYIEEAGESFFDYVKIKNLINFDPWLCFEFLDDMELVKKYIYIFPNAKAKMRKHAFDTTKFICYFTWSDTNENVQLYIDKNRSEKYGSMNYAKRLKKAAGPVSKGGLEVPFRQNVYSPEFLERMQKRIDVKSGGNK